MLEDNGWFYGMSTLTGLFNADFSLSLAHWPTEKCLPTAKETGVQSQVESYQILKKMVFGISSLNTQHYKVGIKGKVEQTWDVTLKTYRKQWTVEKDGEKASRITVLMARHDDSYRYGVRPN